MKKSYLITSTVTTRIVVDSQLKEEELYDIALPRLINNLSTSGLELCTEIEEDLEVPFDPKYDKNIN